MSAYSGDFIRQNITFKHILILLFVTCVSLASHVVAADDDPTMRQIYEAASNGNLDQAQAMMSQVLEHHPNSAKAHYVAAELDARQGMLSAGRNEFQTAERLNPSLDFMRPDAVSTLRATLFSSVQAPQAPTTRPAQASSSLNDTAPVWNSSGIPWRFLLGICVIIGVVIWFIWKALRRLRVVVRGRSAVPAHKVAPLEATFKSGGTANTQSAPYPNVTDATMRCPFCAEEILAAAKKCKHCGSLLTGTMAGKGGTSVPTADYGVVLLAIPVVAVVLIWFWVSRMNLLQSPGDTMALILISTVLGTATVGAMEASKIGMTSDKGQGTYGPISWFFMITLLWIVGYPAYLYNRRRYGLSNLFVSGIVVALIFLGSWVAMNGAIESKKAEIRGNLEGMQHRLESLLGR